MIAINFESIQVQKGAGTGPNERRNLLDNSILSPSYGTIVTTVGHLLDTKIPFCACVRFFAAYSEFQHLRNVARTAIGYH